MSQTEHIKLHLQDGDMFQILNHNGDKNPRWIEPTEEMINDVKNGMKHKDFISKEYNGYKYSHKIYYKIRRSLIPII